MKALLLRAAARFYFNHPWQLALAIAGVALGVAVHVGVSLANDSARRAFELSSEAVVGRTTHRVLPVGGPLDENLFAEIVTRLGISTAAPVVETNVVLPTTPPRRAVLLGVDPVKEPEMRTLVGLVPGSFDEAVRLMVEPGSVLVPEALAEDLGLGWSEESAIGRAVGETDGAGPPAGEGGKRAAGEFTIRVDGRLHMVRAIGTVRGAAAGGELPVVADIATAQELTGRLGTLDRIDLRLDEDTARRLANALPAGATLAPAGSDPAFEQLTTAFHTNLSALGLLALVVGMFLIYSTMSFAIVQRRAVLGTLLAVGLARRDLLFGVLAEALAIGLVATTAGLALGYVLAQGLVELMLRTIGDLSFAAQVSAAPPSRGLFLAGGALGVGATLLSGLGPAIDAARSGPAAAMQRAALERRSRARGRAVAWLALPALAAAALLLVIDPRSIVTAFAALFFVLLAGALLTPAATVLLMRILEPVVDRSFGLPGVLAVRGVTASLSRTGVAAAALAVAVATVVGIGLMITSFRASLVEWLETTLTADLYVSLDGGPDTLRFAEAMRKVPGVAGLSLTQVARLPSRYGELALRAATPGPEGWGLAIVEAGSDALGALEREPSVALAEPFAYRHGLSVGDRLVLPTASGERAFPIVALYRDYNTGGTAGLMSLEHYRALWEDPGLSSIGVHVEDRTQLAKVANDVAALVPGGAARIVSTDGVVELSLDVFDRTFQITEVLRLLAAAIAFLGVLSAALSIELERAHERAVLRAVGLGPRALSTLTLTQTTLLGLAAGLAAMPLGAVLAALLVHVINKRSFGWSMALAAHPGSLLVGLTLAVGAAFLAGVYPAHRVRRTELGRALREE